MGSFIQNQILGMQWLNTLIGKILSHCKGFSARIIAALLGVVLSFMMAVTTLVYGSGCEGCQTLHQNVIDALAEMNVAADVQYITDIQKILQNARWKNNRWVLLSF